MRLGSRLPYVLTVPALLTLCNCGTAPTTAQGKYYLVATNINVPYWQAAAAGLKHAAAQLNVKAEMVGPTTYDPRAQHEAFQRILKEDPPPAGIMVSVGDRRLMRADIDGAIEQGIPVITVDSDAEFSKRLMFIGTDNYKAGAMIGKVVVDTLNGKGNVAVFTMPEQLNLVERQKGLTESFAGHPQLKILKVVDIQGNAKVAQEAATELATKNAASVDAFVCLEAIACPEVAQVLSEKNVTGKLVVAMDTDPRTLEDIKEGRISATIAQKPYTMAYTGLRMLADLNLAKPGKLDQPFARSSYSPIPMSIDTGVTLVNHENVSEFTNESAVAEK